jgi:hypothetical protein
MSNMIRCFNLLMVVFILSGILSSPVQSAEPVRAGSEYLLSKYRGIEDNLWNNIFGIPLCMESMVDSNASKVDMYGIMAYPFDDIKKALTFPPHW